MVNRPNSSLRRAVGAAAPLLIVSLALLAAGCGSSSSTGASATATTTGGVTGGGTGTQTAGLAAFQSCLKQQGVTITGGLGRARGGSGANPPPTTGQGGTPPAGASGGAGGGFSRNLTPAQQKAVAACRSKLPAGGNGFGGGQSRAGGTANPALAKYTNCLSQHGVKFGSTNTDAAAFKKASTACARYLPAKPGGNQAVPTTTTG